MKIYHITRRADWTNAVQAGQYTAPSLQEQGFIHASTREQVADTANRYYSGQTGMILLEINTARLASELRFEPALVNGYEQKFPHIYGPLNLDAVSAIENLTADETGAFHLPEAFR